MSIKTLQKNISNQLQQPNSSARIRCIDKKLPKKQQKSINKQASIKYFKTIQPIREKKCLNNIDSNLLSYLQNYQDEKNLINENIFVSQNDCLSSRKALKTINTNQLINRQTFQKSIQKKLNVQKASHKRNDILLEKFHQNQSRISSMREQLSTIYQTFKQRQKQIQQMKINLKGRDKIRSQNMFFSKQIVRVQQMIKQALLQREKIKHNPLNNTRGRK